MPIDAPTVSRRRVLKTAAGLAAAALAPPSAVSAAEKTPLARKIPSSGEALPVIGLGTARAFDVGVGGPTRSQLAPVLQSFFDNGGKLIDSSPMYGRAERVVGELMKDMIGVDGYFAAGKVWIDGKDGGIVQMTRSMALMGVEVMDLMQIHNLRDWRTHLATLRDWKDQGLIRYIGVTTSHGRGHDELEQVMTEQDLDFVQFSYNIGDRAAEERLLPLARDRGQATLVNRPYRRGSLFAKVKGQPLPDWAAEADIASWGQFFLKFILAHPAVTNVIPATSDASHMVDNMGAGFGRVPDEAMRRRMIEHFEAL